MASMHLTIHSTHPEHHKIQKVSQALHEGAVMLYPTDTGFSLGCRLSDRAAISRLRQIRNLPESKALTFLCDSLTNISEFAKVSNHAYRMIRGLIPGPYTFILPASKSVPRFAQDQKRKTAGVRVPNCVLCHTLLREFGSPVISISAKPNGSDESADEIIESLAPLVDLVITSEQYNFLGESTVIDMTTDDFTILRPGAGYEKVTEYLPQEAISSHW